MPRRLDGVQPLSADQLITLSADDLRNTPLETLLSLMQSLGLSTDGIDSRTGALTRLMQNVYEVT